MVFLLKNNEYGEPARTLCTAEQAVIGIIPERFRQTAESLFLHPDPRIGVVEELRFRTGKHAQVRGGRGELLINAPCFTQDEAEELLSAACGHSVYSREKELTAGFIPLKGGARIGISGAPLYENGSIVRFTAVSGFNIRIARQVTGCAEPFIKALTNDSGAPASAIIAAPPGGGKTTFLRDVIRCFSNGVGLKRAFSVAVADERNELTGCINAVPALETGERTDVITLVPKSVSIPMLIRSMAPELIVTDELSGQAEAEAAAEAAKYGVAVIASIHAGSAEELLQKKQLANALSGAKLFMLKRDSSGVRLEQITVQKTNRTEYFTAAKEPFSWEG